MALIASLVGPAPELTPELAAMVLGPANPGDVRAGGDGMFAIDPEELHDELDTPLPPALTDELARWPDDVVGLRIRGGIAKAARAFDVHRGPAQAGELVALLRRALAAIDAPRGLYRS